MPITTPQNIVKTVEDAFNWAENQYNRLPNDWRRNIKDMMDAPTPIGATDDIIRLGAKSASALPLVAKLIEELVKKKKYSPKVFYHGTPESFTDFDFSKLKAGAMGKGLYFTDSPKLAELYATQRKPFTSSGAYTPNIHPVVLDTDELKIDPRIITSKIRKERHQTDLEYPAVYYPEMKELVVRDPEAITSIFSNRGSKILEILKNLQYLPRF